MPHFLAAKFPDSRDYKPQSCGKLSGISETASSENISTRNNPQLDLGCKWPGIISKVRSKCYIAIEWVSERVVELVIGNMSGWIQQDVGSVAPPREHPLFWGGIGGGGGGSLPLPLLTHPPACMGFGEAEIEFHTRRDSRSVYVFYVNATFRFLISAFANYFGLISMFRCKDRVKWHLKFVILHDQFNFMLNY